MGKKGTIKRAMYIAKQRHGYADGGLPNGDFSDPRYAQMYYEGLPQLGITGQLVSKILPNPATTGSYDAYMKQKGAEYAPKPSVGKTPDFNSTPIQPGTGSSLASMPQFNSQSLGKIPTMQDWAAFNPFQKQAPSSIPPLSQHQFYNGAGAPLYPTKTAAAASPMGETSSFGEDFSTKGDRVYGPMGSESGGWGGSDDSGGWGGGDDSGSSDDSGGDGGDGGGDGGGGDGGGGGGEGEKRGGLVVDHALHLAHNRYHYADGGEASWWDKAGDYLSYLPITKHPMMQAAIYALDPTPANAAEDETARQIAYGLRTDPRGSAETPVERKSGGKTVKTGPVVEQALMLTLKKAKGRRGRPD
jgi:hypothetical protein